MKSGVKCGRYLEVPDERMVCIDNLVEVDVVRRAAAEPALVEKKPVEKTPGVFTVVHAGRFHAQKNQALLLDAFATLGSESELWLLGEGPLEGELRAQAGRLGIASRIRWLGFQSNPYPFFRAADCLALSSDWEGLPNVVIEAMICGTPVVSTRCPFGPDELIEDGRTGLLVPMGDTAAFAEALARLAADGTTRRQMGAAAAKTAATRFSIEHLAASYERLFEEALAISPQPSMG